MKINGMLLHVFSVVAIKGCTILLKVLLSSAVIVVHHTPCYAHMILNSMRIEDEEIHWVQNNCKSLWIHISSSDSLVTKRQS